MFIAEQLDNKQVLGNMYAYPVKSNDGEFDIIDLNFDADTGMITARTTQSSACRLTVKFLTDDRAEVVNTIDKQLVSGCDITTTFAADMENLPEYYLILAELYDLHNNKLCNTQYCETYTQNMQEILHTNIYDFDQDCVLNFDDDPTSNFIALSEDAIIAESSETKNVLLSADYEFGEFVFENADETLMGLKKNDLLYIHPTPDDIIAIAVDSVDVRNDIVTIKQSDEPIDDMFDFIKIEEEATLDGAYVDTSTMDEGVTYQGLNSDFPELNLDQDRKILDSGDQEGKLSTKLSFSIDDIKLSDIMKIGGSIDLTITVKINFYKKRIIHLLK